MPHFLLNWLFCLPELAPAGLDELQKKRDEVRKKELMAAISFSKRTYEKIMKFLNVEEDQDGDG